MNADKYENYMDEYYDSHAFADMYFEEFLVEKAKKHPLIAGAIGKKIANVTLADRTVEFTMEDGTSFDVKDEAQFCCERRYFSTDDDLSFYVGATFLGFDIKPINKQDFVHKEQYSDGEDDFFETSMEQETCFLEFRTSNGEFQICAYNEHNGYYSGFEITVD